MKNLFSLFLLFGLLASSFVSAEDRTSDPNDINVPIGGIKGTDDNWQVNLASQDRLTNEDFNIEIKIQPSDQNNDDFGDYNDSDDDEDDDIPISGASFGNVRKEGFEKTADGDFDLDLIRKEILRKARDDQDFDYTNDDDSTDTDSTPRPEAVDDDLRPDNGKVSTQVVSTDDDKNDEIEDSDDRDDADIVDDQDNSHGDDVDDDYQQDDDSAMADDDYVNDPDAANDALDDEIGYDNDDDSDDGDDATDNFISSDYVKNTPFDSVNLQRMRLNMTTINISPQDSDDTDDDLDDIYNNADDDNDSDSDYYDIYDSKYQEEPERGGLGADDSYDYDYDIFIDIDDSAWASILTNDNEERKQ